MDISREEIIKLAQLSSLSLTEDELVDVREQLGKILTFTEEIMSVDITPGLDASRPVNVFREDKSRLKPSKEILDAAPEARNSYFVVPRILD
jgi:aspartyl-tRNA(Asn)/glutamyl-tRNA(Gln) amidotransferase subunit C